MQPMFNDPELLAQFEADLQSPDLVYVGFGSQVGRDVYVTYMHDESSPTKRLASTWVRATPDAKALLAKYGKYSRTANWAGH